MDDHSTDVLPAMKHLNVDCLKTAGGVSVDQRRRVNYVEKKCTCCLQFVEKAHTLGHNVRVIPQPIGYTMPSYYARICQPDKYLILSGWQSLVIRLVSGKPGDRLIHILWGNTCSAVHGLAVCGTPPDATMDAPAEITADTAVVSVISDPESISSLKKRRGAEGFSHCKS